MEAELSIKEMLEPDIDAAANISLKSWDYPLEEQDYRRFQAQVAVWPWLLLADGEPAGVLVTKTLATDLEILELAIRPTYRDPQDRLRALLLSKAKRQAIGLKHKKLICTVPLRETEAANWYLANGFGNPTCLLQFYGKDAGNDDGIKMEHVIEPGEPEGQSDV